MHTELNWKKDFVDDNYQIYTDKGPVGYLNTGSGSSYGQINGKPYLFNTAGTFGQKTFIYDAENYEYLGEISFNDWVNKATIAIKGKFFNWKSKGVLNNKISLSDTEGQNILYSGARSGNKGTITSNSDDDLLILSMLATNCIGEKSRVTMFYSTFFPIIFLFIMWFVL